MLVKKFCRISSILILFSFFLKPCFAQAPWLKAKYFPLRTSADSNKLHNFYAIRKAFKAYEKDMKRHPQLNKEEKEEEEDEDAGSVPGMIQYKRWEWLMAPRVYPSGDISLPSTNYERFIKYRSLAVNKNEEMAQKNIQTTDGNWHLVSPHPVPSTNPVNSNGIGRINCIKFDPHNSNIIWAGSPSGGLWKSVNGGQSWTSNTDQLAIIGCSDIAIDPSNSNIMYLATGDADGFDTYSIGVLKSSDAAVTWNTTGLSLPVNSYTMIYELLINPLNPDIVFAATSNGLYRTINAGVSWNIVQAGDISDIAFKPGDPSVVYALASGKLYQSVNSGQSFLQLTNGLPASMGTRCAIAVCQASPANVYLLAYNSGFSGLYSSTDNGASFVLKSSSPDIIGTQGYYDMAIVVNPVNSNDIYVGGLNHYRSMDGGVTWNLISNTHVDIHTLEFLPGSGTTFFSGNDGGIGKTTNNGSSFTNLSSGLEISQIYRIAVSSLNTALTLSGLQDNGTYKLSGNNWTTVSGADGMECIVDYTDSNILYSSYQYGNISRSTDGGNNSTSIVNSFGSGVNSTGGFLTPFVMHPTDHNTLLVGKNQVYKSTNAGTSWAQVGTMPANFTIESIHYAPSNPDYIYVTNYTTVYVTTNGSNFINRTAGLPVASAAITNLVVSYTDPQKIWVTFSGYTAGLKVYFSNNAGLTWSNYSAGLPNLPVNCIAYQNFTNDGLYVGTDIGVYFKSNSLAEWKPFFNGLPNVIVNELEIQYSADKIRAATYGRGLWESGLAIPNASFTANPGKICTGSSIGFSANADSLDISSLSWSFPGGTPSTSTARNPVVTYNTLDSFDIGLTLTNANGYSSQVFPKAVITYTQLQSGNISVSSHLVCAGDSVTIRLTGYIGNIQWQSSSDRINFTNINGQISPAFKTVVNANTYFRALLYGGNCTNVYSSTDSVKVNPSPLANITAGGSLNFCEGSVLLQSSTAFTYLWSTDETTASITVNTSGNYYVRTTNSFGCSRTSTPVTVISNMGNWVPKADIPLSRYLAFSFSIGTKLYVGGGRSNSTNYINDFWEYDPALDVWTSKAAFPGIGVSDAAGFAIGNKGYVTGGRDINFVCSGNLWEYDPSTDSWSQKANFPGTARATPFAVTIGNKAYVGTGFAAPSSYLKDVWEYDQTTNTWTQKADFPGTARFSTSAFSIGSNCYVGLGYDLSGQIKNDFWAYDQTTNTWTQKANFAGGIRLGAKGFSLGSSGFVVAGKDLSVYKKDVWEYKPQLNTWKQRASLVRGARYYPVAATIGNKAYVGTGNDATVVTKKDLWEFSPVGDFSVGKDTTLYLDCPGNAANLYSLYDTTGINTVWNTINPALAPAGDYTLYATNTAGCKDTVAITVKLEIATWTGNINNNWHTAGNWNINKVPTLNTHVIIPINTPNPCRVTDSDAEAASVQLVNNATLEVVPGLQLLIAQKCAVLPPH